MSTTNSNDTKGAAEAHGTRSVVSGRYDDALVQWAMRVTGCSKAELVKRGLDRVIKELMEEAA